MTEQVFNRFYDYLTSERSRNTVSVYRCDMNCWNEYCREHSANPTEITPDSILRYRLELTSSDASKAVIQRRIAALRAFEKFLKEERAGNISSIKKPEREEKLPEIMPDEEFQKIINACEDGTELGKRDRVFIELAYGAGLRCSEIIILKVSDFDFENGTLRVCGIRKRERIIPIIGALKRRMQEYIEHYRPFFNREGADWLFMSRNGKKLTRTSLDVLLNKRGNMAGVKHLRLLALRSSFTVRMLESGMDKRTLNELLGNRSVSATERYTRLDMELRDYYDKYHPRAK